jgi:Ni,Fe-hydrogenase I small subunit
MEYLLRQALGLKNGHGCICCNNTHHYHKLLRKSALFIRVPVQTNLSKTIAPSTTIHTRMIILLLVVVEVVSK